MTRRDLLKRSAAFGAVNLIPARVLWGAEAPSNVLTHAVIGCGVIAKLKWHLPFEGTRLVGVADPFDFRVRQAVGWAEKSGRGRIKAYKDFLALLADKDVDIVHICTPPHWHGCMCAMAANAGKDIWCEKPMTRTVGEGKRVMELVKAKQRMFRISTHFRVGEVKNYYNFGASVKSLRKIVEGGVLGSGPIKCVFGEGQGFTWKFGWSGTINAKPEPVPAGFDYDMWLGPAPWKPYNAHRVGTSFRSYWDYDSGGLGDMAQHYLDPLQYILDKDETSPVRIDYVGPKQHPEAVGRFDRFVLTYDDGTEVILDGDETLLGEPLLRGSNGWCVYKAAPGSNLPRVVDANGREVDAAKLLAELPDPAPMETDFVSCCKTRRRFGLNEENGFRSCTMFNLAIVAWRLGRGFDFDPVRLRAVDDPAADRFLFQSMREPWASEFMKG